MQQCSGDDLTIVATPLPGYVVAPGAPSVFEIDMTPSPYAPWPVDIPDEVMTTAGGGEPPEEGALLLPADPELVQVARDDVPVAIPADLTYDVERGGYVLRYTWEALDAAFAEVVTQAEALRAQWRESAEAYLEESYVAQGMELSASSYRARCATPCRPSRPSRST